MASFRAGVIVGVKWSEFFRIEQKNTPVQKFNPDDGQPYMQDNFEDVYFVGEYQVDDLEDYLRKNGIQVHEVGFEDDREEVIGVMIEDHDVEYAGGLGEYSPSELEEHCESVASSIRELGCKAKPKIHFFSYCSC